MRLITLSDTHNFHDTISVPEGDVLVHAGDATMSGSERELRLFREWLSALPHEHKIFVAGNHDRGMVVPNERQKFTDAGVILLHESGVEIAGVRFWGSPYSQFINDYWAFGHKDGVSTAFRSLPEDVDVLVTHGPPQGILDTCPRGNVGSTDLLDYVSTHVPPMHIFGHIHESYGLRHTGWVHYVNTCICDGRYRPVNKPWAFDIENGSEGFEVRLVTTSL